MVQRRGLIFASVALAITIVVTFSLGIMLSGDDSSARPAASLSDLKERRVIRLERRQDLHVVYDNGDVLALSADAQHLGDDVRFCETSQLFESPAHGEKFDIRGFYYAGPGQRGLESYPVRIEGDAVFVDTEHPIQGAERGAGPPREPEGPFCP